MPRKPVIVLVGRPNAGKSTLFNRIVRSRKAIVDDSPGVTRDRITADASWNDTAFTLMDTGGFVGKGSDAFGQQVNQQLLKAMQEADAVILVLDGRAGISPFDSEILSILRRHETPVFYAVNKIDGPEQETLLTDFFELGIDPLFPVSAQHGYGVNDLLDALAGMLPSVETVQERSDMVRVAVVGRPNVGKSSLINRILGEERLLVSEIPGTTRDSVDTVLERRGRSYCLIDTAGIRKRARVSEKLEKFSVMRALRSLDRCDIALLVLDAVEGVTDQDLRIGGYALERGCGCVLLVNKWDLVGGRDPGIERRFLRGLRDAARHLDFAPAMTVSARTGLRVSKIFQRINEVFAQYDTRVTTGQLNRILEGAISHNEPALHRGRRIKFFYATQVSSRPPTFVFFVNYPEAVHLSYQRYLLNKIREGAGLNRTPIRVLFRRRTGREKKG